MKKPPVSERAAGAKAAANARAQAGRRSIVWEYAEALIIAIVLAMVIRTFVVQAFKIPSGSMLQTLQVGDHILVNKFLYRFTSPARGDIIVFKFPQDETRDFIKRVVGLPGDTVELRGKLLSINGQPVEEPYASYDSPNPFRDAFGPVTVPPGHLFMMGDNRDSSQDSRAWGFLDRDKVRGKAFVIYWSWDSRWSVRWRRIGRLLHGCRWEARDGALAAVPAKCDPPPAVAAR
jgi:signal peptidase I